MEILKQKSTKIRVCRGNGRLGILKEDVNNGLVYQIDTSSGESLLRSFTGDNIPLKDNS